MPGLRIGELPPGESVPASKIVWEGEDGLARKESKASFLSSHVSVVETVADARALVGLTDSQTVLLIQSGYAGEYFADIVDTSTPDDGFDVLVTTVGSTRLKRIDPQAPIVITENTTLTQAHNQRKLRVVGEAVLTIPEDATEQLSVGWYVDVKRETADTVAFATQGSDQLQAVGGGNAIADQYGWVQIHKDAAGIFSGIGVFEAVSL